MEASEVSLMAFWRPGSAAWSQFGGLGAQLGGSLETFEASLVAIWRPYLSISDPFVRRAGSPDGPDADANATSNGILNQDLKKTFVTGGDKIYLVFVRSPLT